MSENKKQTLFRFRNTRVPELLSEDSKGLYFIEHPDGSSGAFFAAVANRDAGTTKLQALKEAAALSNCRKTKEDIVSISAQLSELGLYLSKNKSSLTVADGIAKATGISKLAGSLPVEVWESLIYQTATQESGYVREAILQLLVANHFVQVYTVIDQTDEAFRRLASTRVVMPSELFEAESKYAGQAVTNNDAATGEYTLMHYAEAAEAQVKTKIAKKALEEVATYKATFLKANNKSETAAIESHQRAIKIAQKEADEEEFIDQFSKYTFKRLVNYNPPEYQYRRPKEVEESVMSKELSEETNFLLSSTGLFDAENFEELETRLTATASKFTKSVFDRSAFFHEKVSVDGTLVSKCGIDRRFNQKYAYIIKLVEKANRKYGAVLTIDIGSDCLTLDTVIANFKQPANLGIVERNGHTSRGILTVDLLPEKSISLGDSDNGLDVSGEVIFSNGTKLVFSKGFLPKAGFLSGVMTLNANSIDTVALEVPIGFGVTRLGIADYRKVEQTLCCYVPGEVAHIENVMAREYKERSTRRLRKSDDKTTESSSTEVENLTDTSSTTRFDMQKEVSNVLSESRDRNLSTSFDASVSGEKNVPLVGDVKFTTGAGVSADFATSSSMEDSVSESTSFAKDVTEKALERVVSNVSAERVTRIIEEFEEKNQHGFDNRQGAAHISGVYRWVDKIYKNEIQNYGKRLQYEFMIPEPAAFHLISKASGGASDSIVPLIEPLDPRKEMFGVLEPIRNSAHILPTNYHQWAAAYGAEVTPPPNQFLTVGKTLLKPDDGAEWFAPKMVKEEIVIPRGYGIETIHFSVGGDDKESWSHYFVSAAGYTRKIYEGYIDQWLFTNVDARPEFRQYTETVPVSATFIGIHGGSVSFSIKLSRKHSLMEEWQLRTFNAIMTAYEARLQEYKDAIAELEARRGVAIGDNPAFHRRIENTVLKKNCLSYLIGQGTMGKNFITGNEMDNNQVHLTQEMDRYGTIVKFFEQAFEWNIMDYNFYPFYWANREKWNELYEMENDDALFRSFLRAGMARAIVTVRPGFEEAVMYFMETGVLWNGGEIPVIGDDLYLSILDELSEPEYTVGESWETRVPSSLTVIQAKTIGLEAEGLPCYCEEEEYQEQLKAPDQDPLTDLKIHIEGQDQTP